MSNGHKDKHHNTHHDSNDQRSDQSMDQSIDKINKNIEHHIKMKSVKPLDLSAIKDPVHLTLEPGIYHILDTRPHLHKVPDVRISGKTKKSEDVVLFFYPEHVGIVVSFCDNFTMEYVTIHLYDPGAKTKINTLAGCNLVTEGCNGLTIHGCTFNCTTRGIGFGLFFSGPDVKDRSNDGSNDRSGGLTQSHMIASNTLTTYKHSGLVRNNKFYKNIVRCRSTHDGFAFALQISGQIYDNEIMGCRVAVYMCKDTKVYRNKISNSSSEGIFITSPCHGISVDSNKIINPYNHGITVNYQQEHRCPEIEGTIDNNYKINILNNVIKYNSSFYPSGQNKLNTMDASKYFGSYDPNFIPGFRDNVYGINVHGSRDVKISRNSFHVPCGRAIRVEGLKSLNHYSENISIDHNNINVFRGQDPEKEISVSGHIVQFYKKIRYRGEYNYHDLASGSRNYVTVNPGFNYRAPNITLSRYTRNVTVTNNLIATNPSKFSIELEEDDDKHQQRQHLINNYRNSVTHNTFYHKQEFHGHVPIPYTINNFVNVTKPIWSDNKTNGLCDKFMSLFYTMHHDNVMAHNHVVPLTGKENKWLPFDT